MTHRALRRLVASSFAAALVLAACGGGDEPVADQVPTIVTTLPDFDGPVSTVPDDIPGDFDGAIGPVDITGESLPRLEVDVIDADPAMGLTAPVVVGADFNGIPARIDAAQDGPTMVVFLAHWCPHCNDEIPILNEMRQKGQFPAELNVIAVSTSPAPGQPNFPPGEWLAEKDWRYPIIADGVDAESGTFLAAEAFGVSAFPFMTLIDGDGNIAARWSGGGQADAIIAQIEGRLGLVSEGL